MELDGEGVHGDGVNSAGLGGASYRRTKFSIDIVVKIMMLSFYSQQKSYSI